MTNTEESIQNAVISIKQAILRSQLKAAQGVNAIQLSLYYGVGRYISEQTRNVDWGDNAILNISHKLQAEMPGLRGFSASNIKFMRQFYESWAHLFNSLNMSSETQKIDTSSEINPELLTVWGMGDKTKSFVSDFMSVGFSHHLEIIRKNETEDARIFYVRECAANQWSYRTLKKQIEADIYHHKGTLPNNFSNTLPAKNALDAIRMFKDEYLLDFINVEEIGTRDIEDIDERVVENQIVHNIKKFILTFGQGFSFIGNQYRLIVGGTDYYVDLLFYNRILQSLVAVELKTGKFKPQYLGQLRFYLQALDDQVRLPNENATIGLVLCQEVNNVIAAYAVRSYDSPMGVATYHTAEEMPEHLRHALPSPEELTKLLSSNSDL